MKEKNLAPKGIGNETQRKVQGFTQTQPKGEKKR